jgi:hypothetical protein
MLDEATNALLRAWNGEPEPAPSTQKTSVGRPKGGHDTKIDWRLAERLYVEGELDENGVRRYPMRKVIAERAKTTGSNLDQRARRYEWPAKKALFQAQNDITIADSPDVARQRIPDSANPLETRAGNPIPGKRRRRDPLAVLDCYIGQFADAIARRRVRFDTIADFERAVRLRAFVLGQADSIKQTHVTVSLDIMQARHKEMRHRVNAQVDDAVAGVMGKGVPAAQDAEFTEVHAPEHEGSEPTLEREVLEGELEEASANP